MILPERLLTFAAQAPGAQTGKALTASIGPLLETLGAANFACVYVRREAGRATIDRSIANVPRRFQERYFEHGYDAYDPIFQGAVRSGACGYWDEQTRDMTLSRAARHVMEFAGEFKMRDGFTKRVMLDQGGVAVMMASGEVLLRGDRARAAFRMAFDIFANEGARLLKLGLEPPPAVMSVLSRTQLRVLAMRAEGLTNRDIALAMDRTEKTVECHVTEIIRRLEARNMIDAIRIATRLSIMP